MYEDVILIVQKKIMKMWFRLSKKLSRMLNDELLPVIMKRIMTKRHVQASSRNYTIDTTKMNRQRKHHNKEIKRLSTLGWSLNSTMMPMCFIVNCRQQYNELWGGSSEHLTRSKDSKDCSACPARVFHPYRDCFGFPFLILPKV